MKEITDIIGRLHGNMLALEGMERQLAPPPPAAPATIEQQVAAATPPPFRAKREEYDQVKKLAEGIKSAAEDLLHYVDEVNKVPPAAPAEAPPSPQPASAADHSKEASKESSSHKK